jgi:peptidoglycan/xylan/chitin deacetylase (PgdA/CDA1 family)
MTKKFLFALLFATRLTRFVAWLNRDKVNILCYHSVTPRSDPYTHDPYKLHLRIDDFLNHLDYLQTYYHIISLAEFVKARREQSKLPANAVIITFDDGVRNFLTVVAPILLKKGIPATCFIVTGENFTPEMPALNEEWSPADDELYLSWSEIRKLAEAGLDFGSHTCNHHALPDLSLAEATCELKESLQALKTYLGPSSFALSYPHGRTSTAISRLARSLEYSCAVTTALGHNDLQSDLFALRRTVIASDDALPTFAARISGLTFWYTRVSALFRGRLNPISESGSIGYETMVPEELES